MERVSTESIKKVVLSLKQQAKNNNLKYIVLTSKEVRDIVGGYVNGNTRYTMCCRAMYFLKGNADEIIYAPPKGNGSRLKIKYYL